MTTRAAILAEAREWIDTPWQHQAHMKCLATDCGGFLAGVAIALGLLPADWWETQFGPHAGYGRLPSGGRLQAICREFMRPIPIDDAQPGDALLMRFKSEPQHVAFLADHPAGGLSIIHALNRRSVNRVVEHSLDRLWRSRIVEAYIMPGIA